MKLSIPVICCLLCGGCVSDSEVLRADAATQGHPFLTKASLEAVIVSVPNLSFPLTRSDTLQRLGLEGLQLPSLRSTSPTDDRELITLTDPESGGRHYSLLLWYSPSARLLGGESFVKARVIEYVELVVQDDGTGDAPKGVYVLQPPRFPYVRREPPRDESKKG